MYNKEFKIGNKTFKIVFSHKPYYENEKTIVMGFPYNMNAETFDESKVDEIKGYYTFIKYENNVLTLINDMLGNYRTYYMERNNTIYISNDFLYLFNMLPKEERERNEFEIEYWDKHRYTTGEGTFCTKIHKIKPAHIYRFFENNIEEKLYFKDLQNKQNRQRNFEEVLADLRNTVSLIKKLPQKKFLLFSGGADSTLCVKLLQEQGVEFTPVFAKHTPTNSMNYDDTLKIKYSAEKLGINPVDIEVDTTENIHSEIVDIMFTDRNITQAFFTIAQKLKEKYGENIVLLNGQAADSIFGFGPTDKRIGDFLVRGLLYDYNSLIGNICYLIIKAARWHKYNKFVKPKNKKEYLMAFFDSCGYIPLIETLKSNSYFNNVTRIIDNFSSKLKNFASLRMYLKIYTFLQGSDNYVNVQAPEYYGMKSVFLYGTPNIIYSAVQNTDYKYEIYHPKSVVYKILKDVFNYKMPNIKKEKHYVQNVSSVMTFKEYEEGIYQK